MPTPQIQNVAGVWGTASLAGYTGTDRNTVVQEFRAAVTTIVAGNLVALSTSAGYVINCLTDTTASLVIGVAAESSIEVGDPLPVVVHGPVYNVKKSTAAVTAGNFVRRDVTTTAGAFAISAATAVTTYGDLGISIGIVLASQTAGDTTCSIFVNKV